MDVLRYAAFTTDPSGGNPAGLVLDAEGLPDEEMQRIAAEVGYSETAFLAPTGRGAATVRFFSPLAEVPFCGHATIAAAVALAERDGAGELTLDSKAGPINVSTRSGPDGITATLVSVPPEVHELPDAVTGDLLGALRLQPPDLDPALPVRLVFVGNHHPVVGVTAEALEALDQDHDALGALMAEQGWGATVAVVSRTGHLEFDARNPFPPGGVREDPATGSAAAALGGYLRALGLIAVPARVTIEQGRHVGRPGVLTVDIGEAGGIAVTGTAVPIPA